jgi:hypothetical protein
MILLTKGLQLEDNPARRAFKNNIGVLYLLQARYTEACAVFKRLLKIKGNSLSVLANYMMALECAS